MLDRFTALPHFIWPLVEPALDGFENVLVVPAENLVRAGLALGMG
jgi:hypothetical protein